MNIKGQHESVALFFRFCRFKHPLLICLQTACLQIVRLLLLAIVGTMPCKDRLPGYGGGSRRSCKAFCANNETVNETKNDENDSRPFQTTRT
jgi:hypothetical protein